MDLSLSIVWEALGWMALSFFKFVVTPTAAVAAGVPPWRVFLYSAGGAGLGLTLMRPAAKALFEWRSRRRKAQGKNTFTRGRRRLVGIKRRFGLLGIALIGGVIVVPIAGLVAFKYFGHRRSTLPVLVFTYAVWSALLTVLASFVMN